MSDAAYGGATAGMADPTGRPENIRPELLIAVAGTGTEVGKTWMTVRLVEELRARSVTVAARKPAQSFDEGDTETDASLLAAATGVDPLTVCPAHRWYPIAMAPPMAADLLDREPIFIRDLVHEIDVSWHDPMLASGHAQVGLVELAGGPWSPMAHDGDGLDLVALVGVDLVVLVADAGLGTINSVRPAVEALEERAPVLVVLNRYDDTVELHRRNRVWMADHHGFDIVVSPQALAERIVVQLG
ncbi:dethiobiotin synthase [soil metagenome]